VITNWSKLPYTLLIYLLANKETIKKDQRLATLVEFTKIHGVGPSTARDLYDKYGCRTLADVEKIAHKLPQMGEDSIMCM
jgi:DNA polymerase/3'-5' exonuclease PolX